MFVYFRIGDAYADIQRCWDNEIHYDVTLTDPPYTNHVQQRMLAGKKASATSAAYTRTVDCSFDAIDDYSWVPRLIPVAHRWTLIFCAVEQLGPYQAACPDLWVRSGIYCKLRSMPQMTGDRPGNRCEGASIFHPKGRKHWNGGGGHAFWLAMPENRKVTRHPTSKPLLLCMRLVDLFTDPGETVYDPFCGTGSFGIACGLMGRSYVGLDINRRYIENARFRLMHALRNKDQLLTKYAEYKEKGNG